LLGNAHYSGLGGQCHLALIYGTVASVVLMVILTTAALSQWMVMVTTAVLMNAILARSKAILIDGLTPTTIVVSLFIINGWLNHFLVINMSI